MSILPLNSFSDDVIKSAIQQQNSILAKVSRTFALTIPQLPETLRTVVANAYLLCRVADTIEDESMLSIADKGVHERAFLDAVTGRVEVGAFVAALAPELSASTPKAEHDLVALLPVVLTVTQSFGAIQRQAIVTCLEVMSRGMHDFQKFASLQGLESSRDLDRYCYCVAGVVGEMLTTLLIDYEPLLAPQSATMMRLAVSFGQGLQMTNILKDQWEDRERGVCWLPQDVFARYGVDPGMVHHGARSDGYVCAMNELIGVAHAYLRHAIDYTLMVPTRHVGFRRFCLWSIGLALLTLRKLHRNLNYNSGEQVKISRMAVKSTIALTTTMERCNPVIQWSFALLGRGLPLSAIAPRGTD